MTPQQHYDVAEELSQRAEAHYERIRESVNSGRLNTSEQKMAAYAEVSMLTALMQVHATLATVTP